MTYPQRLGKALRQSPQWRRPFILEVRHALVPTPLFCILLAALLWSVPVTAQERAGRFVSVQGPVEVLRGRQTIPATTGFPLQTGDIIRTGATARAAIMFSDGTKLKLGTNATVQLKQLSPERRGTVTPVSAGEVRTVMQFFLGQGWLERTGTPDAL